MKKTERLFDSDSYIKEFTAEVLSCTLSDGKYLTVLDRTAFFPEGGGQDSDTGYIAGTEISYVFEKDGIIYHVSENVIETGIEAKCSIRFDERFRRMQNHTGEHILCGVAHRMFGAENVGFHLSKEYVRVDFDIFIERDKLRIIEAEANKAIAESHPVKAWYPSPEELADIEFRSKKDICGNLRLVSIEGVDVCACCAPHVASSSEVGLLKITDSIKYKGGTRLEILCGSDAIELFRSEHDMLTEIAVASSSSRDCVKQVFERQKNEIATLSSKLKDAERRLFENELEKTAETEGNLCFFFDCDDAEEVRSFVNGAVKKCSGMCAAFFGHDGISYRYIIASSGIDLKASAAEINGAICGRGGGSPIMISGTASADRDTIKDYFMK